VLVDWSRQIKQPRGAPKVEEPVKMKLRDILPCEFHLAATNKKRRFLAEGRRLYLDEALSAIGVEGQNIEPHPVALCSRDMLDLVRKRAFP